MTEHSNSIGVLVIDDHPLFRAGVVAVVNKEDDMHVVAEAGDGNEAIRLYRQHVPHVVLMDLRMPGMGGVDATSIIAAEFPSARILVLTTYQGDVEALRALKAGATGYMLKTSVLDQLPPAIRHVSKGMSYVPDVIAAGLADHAVDESLTLRELAVLKLVADGNSNKLIARQLAISEETIKSHMKGIMSKLGARDRTHAVSIGIQRGIIVG